MIDLPLLLGSVLPGTVGIRLVGSGDSGGGGPASASIAYTDRGNDPSDKSSYTFLARNTGGAGTKHVGVLGMGAMQGNLLASSATIGGVSATKITEAVDDNGHGFRTRSALWLADVTDDGTSDIVINWSIGIGRCAIAVWRLDGINATVHDTAPSTADPASVSLDVPAGGVALGGAAFTSWSSAVTWTGLDEHVFEAMEGATRFSAGSKAFATMQTGLSIGVDPNAAAPQMAACFASFGPA